MKSISNYQQAKNALKNVANRLKENHPTDKPMIRQGINDFTNYLFRDYNLTEHQRNLLSNYACKLHPKN
jgi:uncharacterized protein YpuA (DUF1002 family)